MFCQKCGKQLHDGAKFCTGCGQPVPQNAEGPVTEELRQESEREPAFREAAPGNGAGGVPPADAQPAQTAPAPASPILSGKKRRGKAVLGLAAAAAVAVILLIAAAVSLFSSLGRGGGVYLYATDDYELMLLSGLKEDSEVFELSDEAGRSVYFSPDGKYIYFFEQGPDDYGGYADLYFIEAASALKEGARPQRVSSKVYVSPLYLLDNGGAIFHKESGHGQDLCYFDGEHDTKLADDVYRSSVDEAEQYVYYTLREEDYGRQTLFRIALKDGTEEEILDGASSIYTSFDAEVLLYDETSNHVDSLRDLYMVRAGERAERVAKDVWQVLWTDTRDGKLSFLYLTQETEEHTLYDFVTDSTAASDAAARQPALENFITGYSEWGWEEYDWDAYYAAQDAWNAVSDRVHIRETLRNTPYNLTTYTLHSYKEGTHSVVASGLIGIPCTTMWEDIYLYSKREQTVSPVADLSQLSYYGQIYDYMELGETTTYQNVHGVESELDLEDWLLATGIFPVGDGHVVLLLSDGGEETALVSCTVKDNALILGDVLEDEDFSVCYNSTEGLYYFADISSDGSGGNLVRCQGGEVTVLAKDACSVLLMEDGTVFKGEDQTSDGATLCVVRDGREERIDDDVFDAVCLAADRLLYISDGDLYLWEKGERTRLARDVIGVWASNALLYQQFLL